MKKDNTGESAKPIPGVCNNPKSTSNHAPIKGTVTNSSDRPNQKIPGTGGPPVKK